MKILSLDLGTKTGYAATVDNQIISGMQSFKPTRFEGSGMRFLKFSKWLMTIKDCYDFEMVTFEEVRRHAGTDAAHCYGGFMACLTAFCEERKIPYQGVPVGTIKSHATGKGNASKEMMIAAANSKTNLFVADDNQADAICLLLYSMENFK